MAASKVDAVIVTYNSSDFLPRLAASIVSPLVSEVFVIDNASADSSVDIAGRLDWGPEVTISSQASNLGFGAAMNLGVAMSNAEYVLLINPDVELEEGTIERLVAALDANPTLACVGGVLQTSSGQPVSSARALPTLTSIARRTVADVTITRENDVIIVGWVCGALMLWRREVFETVGGFSSIFFLYFEDTDICMKASEIGFNSALASSARAIHDQGHGNKPSPFLRRCNRVSRRRYARRWLGKSWWLAASLADLGDEAALLKSRLIGHKR